MLLIYINDTVSVSDKIDYVLFACDTTPMLKERNIDKSHKLMHSELEKIYTWKTNKLKLNIKKTKFIMLQNQSLWHGMQPITFGGDPLERVKSIKFLGVVVDENLFWQKHISSLCLNLLKICGILYRVRNQLFQDASYMLRKIWLD